jgi:3',5'-cyclic AMP phosphodiesterase CpdA
MMRPDILHANLNRPQHESKRIGLETFARLLGDAHKDADVIVAAGDIGTGVKAVHFLQDAFKDKPVIFVPGNHDHWGNEYYSVIRKMREAAAGTNVHFFYDGGVIEIDGVMFCAGTLWTNYELFDLPNDNMKRAAHLMNDFYHIEMQDREQRKYRIVKEAMWEARDVMNDHRKIRFRKNVARLLDAPEDALGLLKAEVPRRLIPQDVLGFHKSNLLNIKKSMAEAHAAGKKLVVVSHHAPSRISLFMGDECEDEYVYQKQALLKNEWIKRHEG